MAMHYHAWHGAHLMHTIDWWEGALLEDLLTPELTMGVDQ